jgi:hypothetical protein
MANAMHSANRAARILRVFFICCPPNISGVRKLFHKNIAEVDTSAMFFAVRFIALL